MTKASWFQELFGFAERSYAETQSQFVVEETRLRSLANGRSFAVGRFGTPSLSELRREARQVARAGTLRVRHEVIGDVLELHARPENRGAVFQVASQWNCLEFPGPGTTPEVGITGYANDPTQGPACALAAAGATVYRNYFVPVRGRTGQTRDNQLDNLEGLAAALGEPGRFWSVRNGYTESTPGGLAELRAAIDRHRRDDLLGEIRIGLQRGVGVTFAERFRPLACEHESLVTQAFCSAISCSYSAQERAAWEPLARLALDAGYESTLWAGALQGALSATDAKVWLTLVGGGAFGNERQWIAAAIGRALRRLEGVALDVRIAHHVRLDEELRESVDRQRSE